MSRIVVGIGIVSLLVGAVSRFLMKPLMVGLEAGALLQFACACFLLAIALAVTPACCKK